MKLPYNAAVAGAPQKARAGEAVKGVLTPCAPTSSAEGKPWLGDADCPVIQRLGTVGRAA
ncbi:hypothetical protein GWG65_32095 [Bradyrhizobium sp. CSA207]|uniref:hypothetical protein n=1 Tax=Bradyrhizobium sp. CSA207 TaxID=2698826 RepID=UPI0023AEF51F|nr:hypothetical protein [Bradyrhizobium sp. CSA207]MDE5445970.1 hypothetical protein [Bradyrhizobium sp. CSA207]